MFFSSGFPSDMTLDAVGAVQSQLVILSGDEVTKMSSGTTARLNQLRLVLRCAVDICHSNPEFSPSIVHTLATLLALAGGKPHLYQITALSLSS